MADYIKTFTAEEFTVAHKCKTKILILHYKNIFVNTKIIILVQKKVNTTDNIYFNTKDFISIEKKVFQKWWI